MGLDRYKDLVYIALGVGALFGALYLYTGVWPPVVVVETNSMMHVDPDEYRQGEGTAMDENISFGRMGTLDPGDLVLLHEVDSPDDVDTFANPDGDSFGDPGDVIAYRAIIDGRPVLILHRALTFVEVDEVDDETRYTVEWTPAWTEPEDAQCARQPIYRCTFEDASITIPEEGTFNLGVSRSGFLTKGDNQATNPGVDQAPPGQGTPALKPEPVTVDEIQGKAQAEVPALGLVKLAFGGQTILNAEMQEHPYFLRIGNMVAPTDLWMVAAGQLVAISASPLVVTIARNVWSAREIERSDELSVLSEAYQQQPAPRPDEPARSKEAPPVKQGRP